jgi:hypothetical protein
MCHRLHNSRYIPYPCCSLHPPALHIPPTFLFVVYDMGGDNMSVLQVIYGYNLVLSWSDNQLRFQH